MQPTIATVSLNSAIDQTVTVPGFTADAVNRVETVQVDAGGKGVNVASFLAHFGHATAVAGLLGRDNDTLFARHFAQAGIRDACTRCEGATRTNVKIVDPVLDQVTDLNFPGVQAWEEDFAAVSGMVAGLMARGLDWLALCGSLPAGLGPESYARLIAQARASGVKVALDTSGAPLGPALAARPDIVKPNAEELGAYLGCELSTRDEVLGAARALVDQGIGLVSVSMGAAGAVLVRGHEAVHARPPRIAVASTVGAGDAMVAGLIHAATLGLDLAETARMATAFSLGALGEIGPRLPARAQIDALARDVEITALG
ncbi:1-phosphofructokinase [Rhodobacter sp. TJ_12]|uniref:1-phosphofructokinase n=1 Tax=Rhodobacter sp. TJ_12 TaxID=2029399 RepID=UPI001CC102F5|nr:1-phosphofructokinase [Rhodobacter sp. TJ_12]MBZ4024097.1 1-phosphofructokinase [Rhodobacter sp. TJ_12]